MRYRDTYNDYMTRYEMTSLLRKGGDLEEAIGQRVTALAIRSGAAGVGSGVVIRIPNHGREELAMRVVFASSAWTGRVAQPPRLRTDFLSRLLPWLWDGLRNEVCAHEMGWGHVCAKCGITAERAVDHSWRRLPRGVFR